jgi:hypothetical protein
MLREITRGACKAKTIKIHMNNPRKNPPPVTHLLSKSFKSHALTNEKVFNKLKIYFKKKKFNIIKNY